MRYIKFVLLVSILLMLVSIYPFAQETTTQPDIQKDAESLGIVLDLERPSITDILLLRNGDKLTGTVLNEKFSIRTSYAEIVLNNWIIAGIDLEGGANNIEKIITVNNNRFSGFIDDSVFVFMLQSGAQIEVRREKVLKVVFRVREAERRGIPQRQFITLKNGDYFSCNILNEKLVIATTYAKVPLSLNDAESITLIGGENPLTKVLMLNGDLLQGVLETEDIEVELDVGSTAKIYKDRIDVIYCQKGAVPETFAIPNNLIEDSRIIILSEGSWLGIFSTAQVSNGFRINGFEKNSPAEEAGLKVGDIIASIDGKKAHYFIELAIIAGEIFNESKEHSIIEVLRGNNKLYFTLTK